MNLLSAQDCANRFSVTRKTWYDWWDGDPTFPEPVIRTPGFVRWSEDDVTAYQKLLIAENRTGYVPKNKRTKKKEAKVA